MSFNTEDFFAKIQKKEQNNAASTSNFGANPLILKPKIDCNYSLRLLWLPPVGTCKREYPMINQYVHHYWDANASGMKGQTVYCPTSQYLKGETKQGFDACPICAECSKLYKQSQEGSSSADQLYRTFRRTLRGYVPVYVVNGPDDVVGTIRILQYGKQFKDFFDRKIFGIVPKKSKEEETQAINPDEVLGLEAFMYERKGEIVTDGYNLNISVSSKKMVLNGKQVNMPQYSLDFSRKNSSITMFGDKEVTPEYFDGLNEEISYDKDFYKESTQAELSKFAMKYLNASEASAEVAVEPEPTPSLNPYNAETAASSTPAPTKTSNIVQEVNQAPADSDDDIDVDKLIDGL